MPYVDPDTIQVPTSGQTTLSTWGTTVNDDLEYLVEMPYASVNGRFNQSVPTSTSTVLYPDTEVWDEYAMHSAVSNTDRLTIVEAGIYCFTATASIGSNGTGYRMLQIQVSSSGVPFAFTQIRMPVITANTVLMCGSLMRSMTVGDWVNVAVWHNGGVSLNCQLFEFTARMMGRA